MATFAKGAVVMQIDAAGTRWGVLVVEVYNPSAEEIAANEAYNDTLGNWSPLERPTELRILLELTAVGAEPFQMYWMPTTRMLGPHVRRGGWSKATFHQLERELLRWRLPTTPATVPSRMLALELGQPQHGWLPVSVSVGTFRESFYASYTPSDPIQQLADALAAVSEGERATVWWHLEPAGYWLEFVPREKIAGLRILSADDSRTGPRRCEFECDVPRDGMILTLWRAIRRFQSRDAPASHWPTADTRRLDAIVQELKTRLAQTR